MMAKRQSGKQQKRALSPEEQLQRLADEGVVPVGSIFQDGSLALKPGHRITYRVTRLPDGPVEVAVMGIKILQSMVLNAPLSTDSQWAPIFAVPWTAVDRKFFEAMKRAQGSLSLDRAEELYGHEFGANDLLRLRTVINSLQIPVKLSEKDGFIRAFPRVKLSS